MLTLVNGNLFDTKLPYIMHGCNDQGVMGSGVALIIRNKFPTAYYAYLQRHATQRWKPGEYQIVSCGSHKIINAITQHRYGRDGAKYASYDAIDSIMKALNKELNGSSIAMPKIGSTLGGGDWEIIQRIIERNSSNLNIVVYYL
jgi:O-acetyl-ADP-ribose deacetylase (regulator of RNase III)